MGRFALAISGAIMAAVCTAWAGDAAAPRDPKKSGKEAGPAKAATGKPKLPGRPIVGAVLKLTKEYRDIFSWEIPRPPEEPIEKPLPGPGPTPIKRPKIPTTPSLRMAREALLRARDQLANLRFRDAETNAKAGLEALSKVAQVNRHLPLLAEIQLIHRAAMALRENAEARAAFTRLKMGPRISGIVWQTGRARAVINGKPEMTEGDSIRIGSDRYSVMVYRIDKDRIIFSYRGYKFSVPMGGKVDW